MQGRQARSSVGVDAWPSYKAGRHRMPAARDFRPRGDFLCPAPWTQAQPISRESRTRPATPISWTCPASLGNSPALNSPSATIRGERHRLRNGVATSDNEADTRAEGAAGVSVESSGVGSMVPDSVTELQQSRAYMLPKATLRSPGARCPIGRQSHRGCAGCRNLWSCRLYGNAKPGPEHPQQMAAARLRRSQTSAHMTPPRKLEPITALPPNLSMRKWARTFRGRKPGDEGIRGRIGKFTS